MDVMKTLTDGLWATLCILIIVWIALLYLYRITFHPLASFPGPKLAGMTLWYEFYYDFFLRGRYVFKVKEMHEKYGPIVRVTPDELHVNDPSFVPELMPAGGRRRNKCRRLMQVFGFSEAAGSTVDHDLHRMRRSAMSKMFTKDSVRRLEPQMKSNMDKLFMRFREFQHTGKPINCLPMFGAFTNDLISEYAYGFNSNWLGAPNFNAPFFHMIDGFHKMGPLAMQFSWFIPMMNMIPETLRRSLNPGANKFVEFKQELLSNIDRVRAAHQEGKDGKTVFDEIFDSKISDYEKRRLRLLQEAQNISIAGTETTAWTLSALTFYLLSNPKVLIKLRAELKTVLPDSSVEPTLKDMEQLPYLSAVIQEGFRLSMGTSGRKARNAPDEVLKFNDGKKVWFIPPGTDVSMATPLVHLNPKVFHNPLVFDPERFIEDPRLKRNLMTFSHGSRQCLGIQLAYAELYLMLGSLWRKFGCKEDKGDEGWLELYKTDKTDVEMAADRFVPYPKKGSEGIRIIIRK
ncbi:hypothetical protein MFRU_039g00150 [Monilinia fructicola]|uniref:Cytochrome P450 n=1 Tax=Monilinia fructicola TaxID=38448 RepID=A0A5M9JDT1_MONFR|nr:hypothetical protein EYC84_008673 [Monilinia fructicola]KAG4026537.1 hypothetical protein MFRU_039g00150 [Monilinia fructicola]